MIRIKKYFTITLVVLLVPSFFLIAKASIAWSIAKNDQSNKIVIYGEKILPEEDYRRYILKNENIEMNLLSFYLEKHPFIKAARVSIQYPNTTRIDILEREPIAILNLKELPIALIDNQGYIMPDYKNRTDSSLPILSNLNPEKALYPIGKKVLSLKVKESIKYLKIINKKYPDFYKNLSELYLKDDHNLTLIINDYMPTKIFLGNQDIEHKLMILGSFVNYTKNKKNLSDYKYIDVRYHNQVIAMEKPNV